MVKRVERGVLTAPRIGETHRITYASPRRAGTDAPYLPRIGRTHLVSERLGPARALHKKNGIADGARLCEPQQCSVNPRPGMN